MIGKEWDRPQKVIILILDADGVQHGFEIDHPHHAGWRLVDVVDGDGRSTGAVYAEGPMHRMSVDPGEPMLSVRPPRQEIPGQLSIET